MMRRISLTFIELKPGWHWKFECPYSTHNVKILVDFFSCFNQIEISDIKYFERYEARRYTKAGNTDPSEVVRDDNEGRVDWQRVSTDETP